MVEIPREDVVALLNSIFPFRRIDPELLDLVADHLSLVSYNAGEVIYKEEQPADALFIVYEGTVQVNVLVNGEQELLASLRSGDFFGYEVLDSRGFRETTAIAIEDLLLLKFSEEQIAYLAEALPEFGEALDLMLRSFNLIMHLRFTWLEDDEVIQYLARRHPVWLFVRLGPLTFILFLFLLGDLLLFPVLPGSPIPIVSSGILLLISAFLYAWFVIDYLNDYSVVTNKRVVWQELVVMFYQSRTESPLTAIQAVTTATSFLGRQFDFGDVIIKTYTGQIIFPYARDPSMVQRIVEASWYRAGQSRTQAETAMMERRVAEIVGDQEIPAAPPVPSPVIELHMPPPQELNWINQTLSNLFSMRFEFDGNIIYRKHWWILLAHIWAPTLVLLLLIMLGIYSAIPGSIIPFAAGVGAAVVGIIPTALWWVYQYVDWRNDYFMVTDEQILDVYRKPLAQEERQVAPLRNILSIEFQRLGLIGILLNFGTVYIKVGDNTLTFDEVFNPSEVQRDLFNRLADRLYRDRLAEVDREQQRIAHWLEIYHRMSERNGGNQK